MIDSLYLEAAKKRDSFKEIIPEVEKEGNISELWENIPITPISTDFPLAAGDGSFNKKQFLAYNFYAIGCESVIYDDEITKIDDSFIGSMEYTHYIHELLRNYMSIFELKSAVKTLKHYDIDYYLVDGSLFGDLIRPFPTGLKLSKEKRKEILEDSLEELQDNVRYLNFKLDAKRIAEKKYEGYEDKTDRIMFLSSIEQLIILKQLLKNNRKIIAISKTSTNRDIFKSNIPDISIFDKYTKKEGISKIIYKKVADDIKNDFFIENEYFKNQIFTIFYLRLEDYKNVLKVELPYRATHEEILDLVKKLKRYSADGYPYLLKKAHNDVTITNKDMNKLASIVNITEKIGREMLK